MHRACSRQYNAVRVAIVEILFEGPSMHCTDQRMISAGSDENDRAT